jgi:ferredoxin-NADP reductase
MSAGTAIPVRVTKIDNVANDIKRFRLERLDGNPLPTFSAGAHVIVSMRDGGVLRRNPYSLMSSPHQTAAYEISVLRVVDSRGGSTFMHDRLREGDELVISHPVNLFAADQRGRKHILFAGGIGITPFLAMMAQFDRDNVAFELHYGMRSREHGAYWKDLIDRYGAHRIKVYFNSEDQLIPAASIMDHQPLGTHAYVCGPERMMDFVLTTAREAGWPKENIHSERFLAAMSGKPFDVELVRSGIMVRVGDHQSILDAVEAAGIDAPYLCRGGACGQCETLVVGCNGGALSHHDVYLSAAEKASGQKVMICVSRFEGAKLSLDL